MNDKTTDPAFRARARISALASRLGLDKTGLATLPAPALISLAVATALLLFIAGVIAAGDRSYATAPVARGDLSLAIHTTGALVPREVVEVGAEISGRIDQVAVDLDDRVKKGQILARINTEQLAAQLEQARANLAQAQATYDQASDAIHRDRALQRSGAVSPQQMVAAEGDYSRARAGVSLALAQVNQYQSMLSKATIYSPIDGVVLDRRIQVGQTIVATMATPLLFTLASDLSTMELDVGIEEAKIGQVHRGDRATFFVDAYPGREFIATLSTVHNAPQIANGKVTYRAVLTVDNQEGLLKPGMTATVTLAAADVHNALLVPNGALKFVPTGGNAPPLRESRNGVLWGRVWTTDGTLKPHDVVIGPSDGARTVIVTRDLKSGDRVAVAK